MDESDHTNSNNLRSNSVDQNAVQQRMPEKANYQRFVQQFDSWEERASSGQVPPANLLLPMLQPMLPRPLKFLCPQMQAQMHQFNWGPSFNMPILLPVV